MTSRPTNDAACSTRRTGQRFEAEQARDQDLARRREIEANAEQAEQQRRYVRDLAAGAETSRQRRAAEYVTYLEEVGRGRWQPADEASVGRGTAFDYGKAVRVADEAAKQAVASALLPLIAQAEEESRAADEERDAIVNAYEPPRSRWFRGQQRG